VEEHCVWAEGSYEDIQKKIDRNLEKLPIPKYIQRRNSEDGALPNELYKEEGAARNPLQDCTSKHLLKNWKSKELNLLRLHFNRFRNFQPVEVEDLSKHKMDLRN
jgi:S-adenosylmethionine:tRNA-ribosyltransferase-isomerase (queuine synthetase)